MPSNAKLTDLQRALKACRGSLALVFIYSSGYNILLLAPSLYLLQIYDRVLSSRSLDTLLMLTLITAAAVMVDGLLDTLRRAALSRIGVWLEDRLRPSVFSAAFEYARQKDAGIAAEACRDLSTLRQFIASPASIVLFDLPWALIFFAVLFLVHPLLGIIGGFGALIMLACALASELLTRAPLSRAQAADMATYQRLGGALRNVQAIRAMGMLDGAARLVYKDVGTASEAQGSAARRSEVLQAISKCTRALVQVSIMGAAAWLVLQDHLNAGIIFVSSLLLGRGLAPIDGVVGSWKAFGSARLAYRRLSEVLSSVDANEGGHAFPLSRPAGSLTVDNLTFVPPGSTNLVLQAVSIRLSPGECIGIIGPSGAGKSTLARMIMGISTPTMGRVRLDGADIALWLHGGGAKYLGYLPQEIELFEGTIKDNIARLRDAEPEEVIRAAKLVGLHDTIMQLPRGYDTQIGEGGFRLSGGQRQSLGLARAFFGSPQLVVLDEPNANLDDTGEQALYHAVEQMKAAGTSVIIITHRFGILNVTDKIAVMRGGTVSAFGTSDEIYQKYFRKMRAEPGPSETAAASGAVGLAPAKSEPTTDVAQKLPRVAPLQVSGAPLSPGGLMQWL
ncbi:type I secretion system permease/ATPase [Microvirga roseola]|uniref:type I secretion system permease/ATPase n=1 Tax=Microvirga roseola TaxID=2883126 RepID=UPI001E36949C|nr:type I secretion system permease/ATPase [Microvirga roseola]